MRVPRTYICRELPKPAADGLRIDFGGSWLQVADGALRPGIVIGESSTHPEATAQTLRAYVVEGGRAGAQPA